MTTQKKSATRVYSAPCAVMAWFALLLQLYLIIVNRVTTVPETVISYFSFFTVLTNIIVAVSFTAVYFKGIGEEGSFFSRPKTLTATAVDITIVGLIYNTVLRFLWSPEGLDKVADELLHTVIPPGFIVFWIKFVPRQSIAWKHTLPWLIYPLLYLAYTLLRGPSAQWYPYPFINVISLGYNKVLFNSAIVCAAFIFFALLFVAVAKMMSKRSVK